MPPGFSSLQPGPARHRRAGHAEVRRGLKMGYCDDSYFTSESIRGLKACTDEIADRCKRYAGLTYCQHKYEALVPAVKEKDMIRTFAEANGNTTLDGSTLHKLHTAGMEFVGIPVALPTQAGEAWLSKACVDVITEGPESMKTKAHVIRLLPKQEQAFLLRTCLVPMATHILRSCPPSATAAAAKTANDILVETWSHTNCVHLRPELLSEESLVPKQLCLPISKGGDGITDPRSIANAAFLGSLALWFQPWKKTMEAASKEGALAPMRTNLSAHLLNHCREIWTPIEHCPAPEPDGPQAQTGLDHENTTATNQHEMLRSASPSLSGSERETVASDAPGFVGDLRDALGALRRYDDGRNIPIPAYWEEETRRFGGAAQQTQASGQPTPVFSKGLATIAERSLLRVQRYFSRRIHSAARDRLIQRVRDMEVCGGRQATLPATGEPAWRAHNRLTQLQGPLSGSFLKGLPVPFRCFHDDESTALSCFRFGIPLPSLAQGLGNDMWGDKVPSKAGAMQ